jgi:hypothetical protein
MVTLLWSEHRTTRSSRPKKQEETKNTQNAVKVLTMTRATFVTTALSAHAMGIRIPVFLDKPAVQECKLHGLSFGSSHLPHINASRVPPF